MQTTTLTNRITLLKRDVGVDALNQPVERWVESIKTWGDARFQTGLQSLNADRLSPRGRVSVRVRRTTQSLGIALGMRLTIDAGVMLYEVKDIAPQGRDAIDLVCEAIQ